MRAALFDAGSRTIEKTIRVYWRFDLEGAVSDTKLLDSRERFLPDSEDWLPSLDELIASHPDARWLISSVRRDACKRLERWIESSSNTAVVQVLKYDDLPLKLKVSSPETVGIDRLLAAVAACDLADDSAFVQASTRRIVIQAGSAVTVDLVSADRGEWNFMGGAILPGVPMMLRLLGNAADLLPSIHADDLTDLPSAPGKNTEQAMLLGAASSLVGGVQHLVKRYRSQESVDGDENELPVILSGGDGTRLAPHIPEPLWVESDLVLRGLQVLASKNIE